MAAVTETENQVVAGIGSDYKYGFSTPEDYFFKSGRGLSRSSSPRSPSTRTSPSGCASSGSSRSSTSWRVRCRPGAATSRASTSTTFFYYIRPTEKQAKSWEDLPSDIKDTWDKLGIPEAEKKYLAGVGAQYESEVVYHKLKEDLEAQGVLFLDMDSASVSTRSSSSSTSARSSRRTTSSRRWNSAVWSGGSFIYVPPGVKVEMLLQAYFRINAENMGQFERTLIIVDEGAFVHYVEGCTAPIYSERLAALGGRRDHRQEGRALPLHDDPELVDQRLQPRHEAGAVAYEDATMEVDGNLGSKLTMKYPSIWLLGERSMARCSIAFAGDGQHQDAGGKAVHVAPNTTSVITSKSISQRRTGGHRGLPRRRQGRDGLEVEGRS